MMSDVRKTHETSPVKIGVDEKAFGAVNRVTALKVIGVGVTIPFFMAFRGEISLHRLFLTDVNS